RTASGGTRTSFYGLDMVAKWRGAKYVDWLLQGELWFRNTSVSGAPDDNVMGAYLFPQYYLGGQLYLGALLVYYTVLTLTDSFGADVSSYYLAVEPTPPWAPSEFSRLRLAYAYRGQSQGGQFISNDRVVLLPATFIIGAHPAHEF